MTYSQIPSLLNLLRDNYQNVAAIEGISNPFDGGMLVLSAEFSNLSELIYDFIPAPANSMPDYPLPVA